MDWIHQMEQMHFIDSDGDGLTNGEEIIGKLEPMLTNDSDNDGDNRYAMNLALLVQIQQCR